jgi:hypothetical protein
MSYKQIRRLFLVGILLFAACKKDDTSTDPKSTWSVGSANYTSTNAASFSSATLSAADNNLNGDIELAFDNKPTMNGHYPVADQDSAVNPLGKCIVTINTPTVQDYKGTGNTMVDVILNNGKVTASFSNLKISNGTQSAFASATIVEK